MKLSEVKPEHEVTIERIEKGFQCTKRLLELGIIPGTKVRIVKNISGRVILGVKGSRIALGCGVSSNIFVK